MDIDTEIVKAMLPDGEIIRVEVRALGGLETVGSSLLPFQNVSESIGHIASSIVPALEKVKPKKATVEFGVEIALESGQLTALLVKGTGTSNLKITLEWGE